MEQKIKLRPKQLEQINQIQLQKQQLTNQFNECNLKEGALIELILEEHGLQATEVEQVKLFEEGLTLQLKEKKETKKD